MSKLLKDRFPEIFSELDVPRNIKEFPNVDLNKITYGSGIKLYFKCPNCHSYLTSVHSRTNMKSSCPICANREVLFGFNDLYTWCKKNNREDILESWDYEKNKITPKEITYGSCKKYWFKCKYGHSWETSLDNIIRPNQSCPICSNKVKVKGMNDFEAYCHQHNLEYLLDEWDYDENKCSPSDIFVENKKYYNWVCSRGHKYKARLTHRTLDKSGCPICKRHKSIPELTLFELCKKYVDTDTLSGYKINNWEIDVYIPKLFLCLEYDGIRYHNSDISKDRELRKNTAILSNNTYKIIRIKESEEYKDSEIIDCIKIYYVKYKYTKEYFKKLSEIFKDIFEITIDYEEIREIYNNLKLKFHK